MSPGAAAVLPVIHAVTSDEILASPDFLGRARRVMRALGPRGALHLRAARASAARLYALAVLLAEVQAESGCLLVVNDRVDVALAAGAGGAQLTSRSLRVADARHVAPALPLGASVHDAAEARDAAAAGATWLVAGRPDGERGEGRRGGGGSAAAGGAWRGIDAFRAVAAAVAPLPVIAIGGVRPEHLAALRAAGAHGAAAIRGIWDAENAEQAATAYLSSHDGHG